MKKAYTKEKSSMRNESIHTVREALIKQNRPLPYMFHLVTRSFWTVLIGVAILCWQGCAALVPYVKNKQERYINKRLGFEAPLPVGWMKRKNPEGIILTRDGETLDLISIQWAPMNKAIHPLDKGFQEHMLIPEMAQLMIEALKAAENVVRWDVLENKIITVDGEKAFQVYMEFEYDNGYVCRQIVTGIPHPDKTGVVLLSFYGAAQHYFPTCRPVYDQMVEGFRFLH